MIRLAANGSGIRFAFGSSTERRREKRSSNFWPREMYGSGDEEVPDRWRNASSRSRQMPWTLYIDPSPQMGSSFSQEEQPAKMRRSMPSFPASFLSWRRVRARENDDLSSSRAPEYPLRTGLLCENDKSTGKAARNLDKIPRLARVLPLTSPAARVFLKLI